MDPQFSAQDVLRCDLCETPVPPMYCDFCHVKLCKACVGEHLSDLSKEHKVVPFKHRGTTPKCPTHAGKLCELHCKECDIPVCSLCVSGKHKGHTFVDIKKFSDKKDEIKNDLQELEKCLYPSYEGIASEIAAEKSSLNGKYGKLTTAVTKQAEDWHREINIIVNKQKSDIDEMKSNHLVALNKQADKVTQIIFEVKQSILELKKILDSNDISLTSTYKSRNAEFRNFPSKFYISLPNFSPYQINTEKLDQMFGSLSALSITTEEHGYTMKTPEAVSCPPVKPLLDEPEIISTIKTDEYHYLLNVACLSDEEIWTSGHQFNIDLYNLQGKLLKSIETKLGNVPQGIAVTRSGDLIYTDFIKGTVNIVKNKKIQKLIKLREWTPRYVCITSSDDLLVIMHSDDKQTKVVRYSGSAEKQTIQFDYEGKPLYSCGTDSCTKYICENRNLDILVADNGAGAVVVVNQAGKLRFRYTGHPSTTEESFEPTGITTDSQGQILTANEYSFIIHILDQDGQFLRCIDNCNIIAPRSLCVDTKDNLFVAQCNISEIKKIRYM